LLSPAGELVAPGLALGAGFGRSRKHGILGSDPSLSLAAQEHRHSLVDRCCTNNTGLANSNQYRSFGIFSKASHHTHWSHLIEGAPARSGITHYAPSPTSSTEPTWRPRNSSAMRPKRAAASVT